MDFYNSTSRLLDILLTSERPPLLRPLCAKQGPRSYALLAETLKYAPTLARIVRDTDIVQSEQEVLQKGPKPSAEALAMLLVHDFFFAKKGIDLPKDHKVRLAIERYASR
jgi:putative methyltransferase